MLRTQESPPLIVLWVVLIPLVTCWGRGVGGEGQKVQQDQSTNDCEHIALTNKLAGLAGNYSHIARLVTIGKSSQGKELRVMILSDEPGFRPLLRPQVKFVGNINGFSTPACLILLRLIQNLVEGFQDKSSLQRKLLETTEIHIIPNINPDAFEALNSALNSKTKVKLNRDFPDVFNPDGMEPEGASGAEIKSSRQPETKAVMKWIHENNFILSLSLISGAKVISVPFDNIPTHDGAGDGYESSSSSAFHPTEHLTPDKNIFQYLAESYWDAVDKPRSWNWNCPNLQKDFPNGIVNGADWYPAKGTMMDYNYVYGSTFELMLGLSCSRSEDKEDVIQELWEKHKPALLNFILESGKGVRGQVVDSVTGEQIPYPEIIKDFVQDEPLPWSSSAQGEFWRPERPGLHAIKIRKEGYQEKSLFFEVMEGEQATFLHVQMDRINQGLGMSTPTSTSIETTTHRTTPTISSVTLIPKTPTSTTTIKQTTQNINISSTFVQGLSSMFDRLTSSSGSTLSPTAFSLERKFILALNLFIYFPIFIAISLILN